MNGCVGKLIEIDLLPSFYLKCSLKGKISNPVLKYCLCIAMVTSI